MVIADGEAAVATRTVTAWPHVGQNAVAFEISLPHFEQYTESPFVRMARQGAGCGHPTSRRGAGQSPAVPVVSKLAPITACCASVS